MKHYGVRMLGPFILENVPSLPPIVPDEIGRLVYLIPSEDVWVLTSSFGWVRIGGGGSAGLLNDAVGGMVETPKVKEYTLVLYAPSNGTITSVSARTKAGSCRVTCQINGSNITLASTLTATTTKTTVLATGANAFVTGNVISFKVSHLAAAEDLVVEVNCQRSLV